MDGYDGMDLNPLLLQRFSRVPRMELVPLAGQASSRRYYRLLLSNPQGEEPSSLIVMRLPPRGNQSDELGGICSQGELDFLQVGRLLEQRGIRVPHVWVSDQSRGILLLEDLGDESFEKRLRTSPITSWEGLYCRAVDILVDIRHFGPGSTEHIAYQRRFDHALFQEELDHFRQWGLEALWGPLSQSEQKCIDRVFSRVIQELTSAPTCFVHRDYQSRNLHWKDDELVLIDFQDALVGPFPYDLVALLCDSYISISPSLQNAMIARYASTLNMDLEWFTRLFWWQALQRKLKDAGRFIYIDRVRGNPSFLEWYPQSLVYVGRALARLSPNVSELNQLLSARIEGFPDNVMVPSSIAET